MCVEITLEIENDCYVARVKTSACGMRPSQQGGDKFYDKDFSRVGG